MSKATRQLEQELRNDMANAMKRLLGSGYVESYYADHSAAFVSVAQSYALARLTLDRHRRAASRAKLAASQR